MGESLRPGYMMKPRFAILTCIARYGRYIPVRQVTGTWTARYRAVPSKISHRRSILKEIDRRRSIEEEKGKKKRKRKKEEEGNKEYLARLRPRPLFLPREETERLPARVVDSEDLKGLYTFEDVVLPLPGYRASQYLVKVHVETDLDS
ncbi:hypothetical protein GW17_00016911 [Ensete ventricosum]|nr:hypothetical protein GW17_00016911 [Ensete ventricosum]